MNEWINVKDRLPEYTKAVLALRKDGMLFIGYRPDKSGWCAGDIEFCDRVTSVWSVTHWQPLPEPPEQNDPDGKTVREIIDEAYQTLFSWTNKTNGPEHRCYTCSLWEKYEHKHGKGYCKFLGVGTGEGFGCVCWGPDPPEQEEPENPFRVAKISGLNGYCVQRDPGTEVLWLDDRDTALKVRDWINKVVSTCQP